MASTYLSRTQGSATNRKKFTISVWFKISNSSSPANLISAGTSYANDMDYLTIGSGGGLSLEAYQGGTSYRLRPNRLFRDTNAWYHLVIAFDSTQATSSDRMKMYLNGEQITSFSTTTYPSLNFEPQFNNNVTHMIGRNLDGSEYFNGSMSHVHFIDGTAYDASAFGQYDANGVWTIKTSPSVTYGTNGFFILKDGNSVTDQSGNSNNFTVGAGTLTNTEDNPSNVFCTYNPLIPSDLDYANGNTDVQQTSNTDWEATKGTLGFTEGKYYWEVKISSNAGDPWDQFHGIAGENAITSGATYDATPSVIFAAGGTIDVDGTITQSGLGQSSDGDIIGIAVDADNSNIDFYRNGTQVGTTQALSSNSGFWLPFSGFAGNRTAQANFGNGYFGTTAVSSAGTNASGIGIFEYDVPTGYTALSTKGLNL